MKKLKLTLTALSVVIMVAGFLVATFTPHREAAMALVLLGGFNALCALFIHPRGL
jgi:hypothetical protein